MCSTMYTRSVQIFKVEYLLFYAQQKGKSNKFKKSIKKKIVHAEHLLFFMKVEYMVLKIYILIKH
jgi:hypothetical protein